MEPGTSRVEERRQRSIPHLKRSAVAPQPQGSAETLKTSNSYCMDTPSSLIVLALSSLISDFSPLPPSSTPPLPLCLCSLCPFCIAFSRSLCYFVSVLSVLSPLLLSICVSVAVAIAVSLSLSLCHIRSCPAVRSCKLQAENPKPEYLNPKPEPSTLNPKLAPQRRG